MASRAASLLHRPVMAPKAHGLDLRVLSFNVLADGLAQNGAFADVPAAALEWEARKPLILAEIGRVDADVVCLQEVTHYDDLFAPALAAAGMDGILCLADGSKPIYPGFDAHGVALFWKTNRLEPIDITAMTRFRPRPGKRQHATTTQAAGPAIASGAFRDLEAETVVSIHATHLQHGTNADAARKRTAQMRDVVLPHVAASAATWEASARILAGDFNADPWEAALAAAAEAGLSRDDHTAPAWTTWKKRAKTSWSAGGEKRRAIDYILHDDGFSGASQVWSPPADHQVRAGGGLLPSRSYGSDHIAIAADLTYAPTVLEALASLAAEIVLHPSV